MTLILIISSIVCLALSDWLNWKYYRDGGKLLSELSKITLLIAVFVMWYLPFETKIIVIWLLFRYPLHQIITGILRHKNALYLGTGWFDRLIYLATGKAWWFYVLSLAASLGVGIHLYFRL